MFFVNQRLKVLPQRIRDADQFSVLSPEKRLAVRDAFVEELDLIENFIDENPANFSFDELEIIKSWHELVVGEFFILRYLKKYTVFLSLEDPPIAFGVLALTQTFEELVGPHLPVMTRTVLLPFEGKIVYDGLLSGYPISFGAGIRRNLKESYETAKKRQGIVTSLPVEEQPVKMLLAANKKNKRPTRNPFRGRWRITWMDQWNQDFVDEEVEGFFEFARDGFGEFQFGLVRGEIDFRLGTRDNKPCIEFSWEGDDEMDAAQGRGWALLNGGELEGMIFFHRGDESAFRAIKTKTGK